MRRVKLVWAVGLVVAALCVSCGRRESAPKPEPPKGGAAAGDVKAATERSIEKAAGFLRGRQAVDGGWGQKESDVGITGLVLEALARAPGEVRKKNADVIEKGVGYLLSQRRPDGSIVNKDGQVANYRTSIATRALIALDREKYKEVIDAAVKYTKGIQNKDPKDTGKFGGIGYGSDPSMGDAINEGEALEMLAQAGVKADDEVWKNAMVFLGRLQNSDEYAEAGVRTENDFGAIYRTNRNAKDASKAGTIKLPDGTEVPRSYGGATYNLLKSLLFAGMKKDHPRVAGAYNWVCEHYTVKEHPEMGQQGLYYFYYTMARTLELWGSPVIKSKGVERNWAEELARQVVSLQAADGSWVNKQDRWWEGDPTLVTGYTISTLNICYRVLKAE